MNKTDRIIVALLFFALMGWLIFQPTRQSPPPKAPPEPAATHAAPAAPAVLASVQTGVLQHAEAEPPPSVPEERLMLNNAQMGVTVSSWGASARNTRLNQYRQAPDSDAKQVFDFDRVPALSIEGLPGFGTNAAFTLSRLAGDSVRLEAGSTSGVTLVRTITLGSDYRLTVVDSFSNRTDSILTVPAYGVRSGAMSDEVSRVSMAGIATMGIDTLGIQHGGKVRYWGTDLPTFFGLRASTFSCSGPDATGAPESGSKIVDEPILWVAVKNRFFVQILQPAAGCSGAILRASRRPGEGTFAPATVSAVVRFNGLVLAPGEASSRTFRLYVGPKKYWLLRSFGHHMGDIMEFGMFHYVCKLLLVTLNGLHALIPNYGIAIILLTVLVRIVFWPLTHKSTKDMQKMAKLQPQLLALREKLKDNPQKMNQETFRLYRENKVSPVSGCLPMLIQIPVFFALYVVLRSAVELRFAPFLYIVDLSEPEGLLAGHVPIVGSLNILPFLMTATMVWQQKLTPSTADPAQQKIMMGFSIAMMFLFYGMPSALLLYWTVSQTLSIVQLLHIQRKQAADAAIAAQPARR
jgi:YidC/Oxa1 family membrane protein insertase